MARYSYVVHIDSDAPRETVEQLFHIGLVATETVVNGKFEIVRLNAEKEDKPIEPC